MIDIENIDKKFFEVVASSEWKDLQEKFNNCNDIYVIGHGGNLAIADHTAIDISRLSHGRKNAICPGSGVVATSLINDTSFEQWLVNWLKIRTETRSKEDMAKSLVYGISSSGNSPDVLRALQWASDNGMQAALVTGKSSGSQIKNLTEVVLNVNYYHTAEVLTLLLQYQLTHGAGNNCPSIKSSSTSGQDPEASVQLNRSLFSLEESNTIALDFDGVIHKSSLGYHDGTVYDDPVEGVQDALKRLSSRYSIVIFSTKARPDRGLVNGKTGTELIWEWLKKHELDVYITKVSSEKPRATRYIDDRAIEFIDWPSIVKRLGV